ncbi:hypothetical protein [Nonomuraea helvata]|uniref:Major facilitator superfamily (MFS) profile domain-containing protein n=1 Tax=Nonomuraea helvata TaxID=37484 RepID=A0ABV5S196_9ACTN
MFGVGLVLGQAVTAVQVSAFAAVGPEVMGRAMTLFQSVRMLGGGLGVGRARWRPRTRGTAPPCWWRRRSCWARS